MSKPLVQRPQADADIDQIFLYLHKRSPRAANQFLDAIQAAYVLLADQPGTGSTRHAEYCPELPCPLRFHPLKDFPRVLIYYMNRPEAVEVIRVWDAARRLEALLQTDLPQP
jgi:toxin ParE1/3/4